MRTSLRRLMMAAALVALVLVSAAPDSGTPGPYRSALADAVATPAYAAQGCGFKACQFVHGRIACGKTTSAENCKSFSGACETKPCPV
ncbi:MAG: hypothetical protein ACRD5D_09655 [Candidatus Polarisedimenticolia bacterium]